MCFVGALARSCDVLLQIWIHGIGVFMVFVITLALFPTVLTNIQSVSYHSDKPEKHT